MRIVNTLFILTVMLLLPNLLEAQLLELKPKLFSLRNARVSFGIGADLNWTGDTGGTGMNKFVGELPESYDITFDTTMPPYRNYSVFLDIFAPNSRMGIMFGGNYNSMHFNVKGPNSLNTIDIDRVEIPVYLKYKIGKVHSSLNAILLAGGNYAIPLKYSGSNGSSNLDFLANTFAVSWGFALQFNYKGSERAQSNLTMNQSGQQSTLLRIAYPRIWIFYKGNMLQSNLFEKSVIPGLAIEEFDYRDINHTMGIAVFLGSTATDK